jgi:hypothetical protein
VHRDQILGEVHRLGELARRRVELIDLSAGCARDPRDAALAWPAAWSALPVLTGSVSIGDSYGPMGSDGCRGTRLQHSGRRHGGTGSATGPSEGAGEDLRRTSPPALTRLPARPLLHPWACSPSRRALRRISGDRVRGDDPAATPLAGPEPLALGPIREAAHVQQVRGRAEQRHDGGRHERAAESPGRRGKPEAPGAQ